MKTIVTLFLVAFMALFIGCGGGGGSGSSEQTTPDDEHTPVVTASYNYNSDGSAARTLDNEYVNTYTAIEQKLKTLKNDKASFTQELNIFISQVLEGATSNDKVPSFAPRGDSKSLIVAVKDSKIDYTSYTLKGDVNSDNSVDFDDIDELVDALFSSSQTSIYDVNNDGSVDIKDIIEMAARLNTHIAYFDFYTTSGQKLDIAARSVSDTKIVDYSGSETQVMVVAKDENMASSFESTLSDIDDVWYKQSGWEYQGMTEIANTRASKVALVNSAIDEALNITPSPYLVGWHFSVDYVETGSFADLDEYGLTGMDFYFNKAKDKIDFYFRKADMDIAPRSYLSKVRFLYHVGSTHGKQNEVSGKRVGFKQHYSKNGETINIRQYAGAFSVLYESLADKTLTGTITKEPKLNGTITLHRTGPDKEDDFKGTVTDNQIEVKNLPFGEFTSKVEDACLCSYDGKNTVFDEGKTNLSFELDSTKANVVLTIVDSSDNPLKDKVVELKAKECLKQANEGSSPFFDSISDGNGKVYWSNVLIGDYEVYVDNKKIKDIHFCENYNDKIVLNPLWKFHATYASPLGGGSMTVKRFPIDIDKIDETLPNTQGVPAFIVFVGNDYQSYPEKTTISYSGLAYDPDLSPLLVASDGVDWHALLYVGGSQPYQIGSISGSSDLPCSGVLPADFESKVRAGESASWTAGKYGYTCTFLFEPCQNEACD